MDPSVSQNTVLIGLKAFLTAVLPDGTKVVTGEINRVPEPKAKNFVVMTPISLARLRTNVDGDADCKFTAAIAAASMTVSAVAAGTLLAGATVFGTGIAANTKIVSQTSGTAGGIGVYVVSISQTLSSRTLSAGQKTAEQGTQIVVQLDFHSEPASDAGDMAQTVSTLLRDAYATEWFADNAPTVFPLFADNPRQAPFINDQQMFEYRWMLECNFQFNPLVRVPQQYADNVDIPAVSVDAIYEP